MASTHLSCPCPLTLSMSSSSHKWNVSRYCWKRIGERKRVMKKMIIRNATQKTSDDQSNSNDNEDSPAFNPFGFVTDNPSSRSAIQLPESPAEDGNVGQMLYDHLRADGEQLSSFTEHQHNHTAIETLCLSYVLKLEKADIYRLPYLSSSGPGFALLEAARKINFSNISNQIAAGFASGSWDKPVLLAWGISDKYLPQSVAEEFQKGNPSSVKLKLIEGAGNMPQEDWPEKVVDALRMFF